MMYRRKSVCFALLILCLSACQPKQADHARFVATDVNTNADINNRVVSIDNAAIEQAFYAKKSDVQLSGKGVVSKLLNDDNKGSRHQKFLVNINAQQTLLFAHNIDLAPRVPLAIGDEISFYGEYVYNPKGGIMHWTHRAPRGDHVAGWIMHDGIKYQ